jgi:hypothetical protein
MDFLEFIRARLMMRVGRTLDENLRARAFDIVNWHALQGDPKVRMQPVNDVLTLRQFLSGPGPFAFFDMPWAPIYLGVIYMLHPVLGIASACAVVLLAVVAVLNNWLIREPTSEAHNRDDQGASHVGPGVAQCRGGQRTGHVVYLARPLDGATARSTGSTDTGNGPWRVCLCRLAHASADVPVRHPGAWCATLRSCRRFRRAR